jgi:RNA polymerase sigma-B factor
VQAPGTRLRPVTTPGPTDQLACFRELAASRDPALRARIVETHLGLAHYLARRFSDRGESYEDLVQVASLALVNAVDRFDPTFGTAFSTFAARTIVGELKRHFRDRAWAVRAPRRVQERSVAVSTAVPQLTQELGRSPTVAELAACLGATEEEVLQALEAGHAYRTVSLDVRVGDGDSETLGERICDDQRDPFDDVDRRAALVPLLRQLPERERRIVTLRFVHNLTQAQIAKQVGISQMHVSRLLARSLRQLRSQLLEGAPPPT